MSGRTIVCIGECMVELSAAPGGLLRRGFAGDTFNAAWYLRRELGPEWTVAYLTAVGDDKTSDEMTRFIAKAGISTEFVRRAKGRMPGLYLIHLEGAERSFSYWRDTSAAKELASDAEHLERVFAAGEAFYVSGITLAILSQDNRERLLSFLASAKAAGKTVAFDTNIRARLWRDEGEMRASIEAGARAATICLPSFPDEEAAFGDASPQVCAERYLAFCGGEVVVKNGPEPAIVGDGTGFTTIAAEKVAEAVDTTGAGDSFSAAYLAARLSGASPVKAAQRGHALAGEVVRHYGALIKG